jgi:hypothetical protein
MESSVPLSMESVLFTTQQAIPVRKAGKRQAVPEI